MKADNRNIFAIKAFLREYLDLRKDKDNELATVDSIRKGVEFKGANLWILIFGHFHGFTRTECQLDGRDYRCHVDFSVDGPDYGGGTVCRYERFRVDEAFPEEFPDYNCIQCHDGDCFLSFHSHR